MKGGPEPCRAVPADPQTAGKHGFPRRAFLLTSIARNSIFDVVRKGMADGMADGYSLPGRV